MDILIASLVLGVIVGTVSSLFAIGGGIFLAPLLPLLLGFSAFEAAATGLVTIFLVTLMNTLAFSRHGLVRWPVGIALGVPAAVTAFGSGYLALKVGEFGVELVMLFVLLFVTATTFLRRNRLRDNVVGILSNTQTWMLSAAGAFIGFISAFSGIGGGALATPVFVNLRVVKEDELVPTANFSTCITTFTGGLGYFFLQSTEQQFVDFRVVMGVFVVASVTAHFVRPFQRKVPGSSKVIVVCAILSVLILQQLFRILRGAGWL